MAQNCKVCSQKNIKTIEDIFNGLCPTCSTLITAYNRYYASNIPVEFWILSMKDFKGPDMLKKIYENVSSNLEKIYTNGESFCLAGTHGVGKSTVATNILKKACQKNFSCQYTTLTDMINLLVDSFSSEKFNARYELMTVDYLVLDEVDGRFVGAGASSDLFGKTLEHIFRTRSQNKLPTIFCSNSPNPIEAFSGALKQSIESLFYKVKIIPVIGPDFRKNKEGI